MTASSQIVLALLAASTKYTPMIRPTFGWLLRLDIQQSHRNPRPHCPLYFLFFCRSIRHPKRWANVLPHAFRPCASSLQCPPYRRHHRSVGCHVFLFKWRPPKTGAPPVSQLFHGRHFSAHNKGTKRSARKPERRAPL